MNAEKDSSSLLRRLLMPNVLAREFDRLRPFIRRRITRRLDRRVSSRVDPSDIIQEAFVVVQSRISDFVRSRPMPFRNWVRLLAQQLVVAAHRKHLVSKKRTVRREKNDRDSSMAVRQFPDTVASPPESCIRQESNRELVDLISKLSPSDQRILMLRDLEEKTNIEVAEILEITPLAASKRHSRALQRLRLIAQSEQDDERGQ